MASLAGAFVNPFRNTYRYMQRQAHENPVIFFSIVLGSIGEGESESESERQAYTVDGSLPQQHTLS